MTRIAVIRALALGDMLCAIPALRAVRARYPDAEVSLIGLPWAVALVARFPDLVDELIEFPGFPGIPEVPLDPTRTARFLTEMRRRRFDIAIQVQGNGLVINGFVALLGATRMAGFVPAGLSPPREADGDVWLPYPDRGSEVDRLLALTTALGAPSDRRLEFPLHDEDRLSADSLLRSAGVSDVPTAVLHAGGSRPERRWPAERFAEVGDALDGEGLAVVLTGTAGEAPVTAAVRAAMRAPAVDLAGQTDLGTLGALLERARIVVTNDTGVSHLAAALGADSVTVFSASDRERWAPVGSERNVAVGDGVPDVPDGVPEMTDVSVDVPIADVLAATRRLLVGRTTRGIAAGRRRSPR
jgi:ADP-heptose:LPS heptosyltransferase